MSLLLLVAALHDSAAEAVEFVVTVVALFAFLAFFCWLALR